MGTASGRCHRGGSGGATVAVEGKMVDKPVLAKALRILQAEARSATKRG